MENSKKEKAIAYAIASLKIDGMILRPQFINNYRKKHNLPYEKPKTLTLKKGVE